MTRFITRSECTDCKQPHDPRSHPNPLAPPGAAVRTLVVTVIVIVMLGLGCVPLEDSDEFQFWRDRFFSLKYEREEYYGGFHWYQAPPWTARQAVEQLAYRIAVDGPDLDTGTFGLWGFAVFNAALDSGTAEKLPRTETWEVVIPSVPELGIGESVWRISEKGGYEYFNKAAAQIAACLFIDLDRDSSGEIIRLNSVSCPAD